MFGKLFAKSAKKQELPEVLLVALESALGQINDKYLNKPMIDTCVSVQALIDGRILKVSLVLPYPAKGLTEYYQALLEQHVVLGVDADSLVLSIESAIDAAPRQSAIPAMQGVKNIIAVASGKGGVGKSTTTVNIALAMAKEGARVGILDADIYGPSLGQMMNVAAGERPASSADEKYFIPIERHGVQTMSMAYLVDENTPMVWRGPMVSSAMQQLLTQTKWDDLDYLFIDMPPGTGDIQLTLSQKVAVSGSVVVTTPQDIALLDAVKGVEMFRKVGISVLGIVENMSVHQCSNCGHSEHIFGSGGGEKIADQYDTQLLGRLPLTLGIRQQADIGVPIIIAEPNSLAGESYSDIARRLASQLVVEAEQEAQPTIPSITISDD